MAACGGDPVEPARTMPQCSQNSSPGVIACRQLGQVVAALLLPALLARGSGDGEVTVRTDTTAGDEMVAAGEAMGTAEVDAVLASTAPQFSQISSVVPTG